MKSKQATDQQPELPRLSPTQKNVFDSIVMASVTNNILHVSACTGLGRTTILRHLQTKIGAHFLCMLAFVESHLGNHPYSLEESFYKFLKENLDPEKPLILDNFHLLTNVGYRCYANPRSGFYDTIGQAVVELVGKQGSQLIVGSSGNVPAPFRLNAFHESIQTFESFDYAHLIGAHLIDAPHTREPFPDSLDIEEIYRFAPRLNGHQLSEATEYCKQNSTLTTTAFIEYLRNRQLASNVELDEVDEVHLSDLVGIDDLVESLEANVAFPLEDDARAQKYGLRPKRGVLLLGPPGTGKTTIGKALAHRLRGKFFLIDGTFISGTEDFYCHVAGIFEKAKRNAPSVIFVDDSDVIFESGREHGLYRYLLTMLDGLESESAGRVCVMLTAMDIRHIPPALIRSGRVELWLETSLPDKPARATLISSHTKDLDLEEMDFDLDKVSLAAEGCTPADLKRLINEAKIHYAWDEKQNRETQTLTQYLLDAINELNELKERYRQGRAENTQLNASGDRPVWFDVATP